jgi:hypothetical protein
VTAALELARLVAPAGVELSTPPPPATVGRWAAAWAERLGLGRPGAVVEAADPDPGELVWWLLAMVEPTYRRTVEPATVAHPDLVRRLDVLLAGRPSLAAEHAQLHIDSASVARRAAVVHARLGEAPGPVLAVGDDDGVAVALALLGVREIVVVDIDERVLEFVAAAGAAAGGAVSVGCVDVFEDAPPVPWRRAFSAVITDPIRSLESALAFLDYGACCLRSDTPAGLFWADHPDWNLEVPAVLAELERRGLSLRQRHEDWHRYPVAAPWLGDLSSKAAAVGVEATWLRQLGAAVCGWSHLYELHRATPAARAEAGLTR